MLLKQVQQLEAQVAFLKERAGIPIGPRQSKLDESLYRNDTIREALRQQHLGLANAQSAVLECLVRFLHPCTCIVEKSFSTNQTSHN